MQQVEISESELSSLLATLALGEEVVLTEASCPVARLVKIEALQADGRQQRGAEMARILSQLAARQSLSEIQDPVAWQREARQGRSLPGRE